MGSFRTVGEVGPKAPCAVEPPDSVRSAPKRSGVRHRDLVFQTVPTKMGAEWACGQGEAAPRDCRRSTATSIRCHRRSTVHSRSQLPQKYLGGPTAAPKDSVNDDRQYGHGGLSRGYNGMRGNTLTPLSVGSVRGNRTDEARLRRREVVPSCGGGAPSRLRQSGELSKRVAAR